MIETLNGPLHFACGGGLADIVCWGRIERRRVCNSCMRCSYVDSQPTISGSTCLHGTPPLHRPAAAPLAFTDVLIGLQQVEGTHAAIIQNLMILLNGAPDGGSLG